MKSHDYTDLRNKTIFDFCTDAELKKYFGHLKGTKDELIKYYKDNPFENNHDLSLLAYETNNGELYNAINTQFGSAVIFD